MIQHLADARLVVTDRSANGEEQATLAHETLIQHWDRLQDWLEEDQAFHLWQHRLGPWLRHWEASGQAASALLRGSLLAEAEGWSAEQTSNVSAQEISFIESSVNQRKSEETSEEERKRREFIQVQALAEAEHQRAEDATRSGHRLRLLAVALLLLLLLATSAGIVALRQSGLAEDRRLEAVAALGLAEKQETLAQARQLSAQAVQMIEDQVQVGLLLSLESLQRSQERQDVLRLFTGLIRRSPVGDNACTPGRPGESNSWPWGRMASLLRVTTSGRLRTWRETQRASGKAVLSPWPRQVSQVGSQPHR